MHTFAAYRCKAKDQLADSTLDVGTVREVAVSKTKHSWLVRMSIHGGPSAGRNEGRCLISMGGRTLPPNSRESQLQELVWRGPILSLIHI